jgi:hypothetical protein
MSLRSGWRNRIEQGYSRHTSTRTVTTLGFALLVFVASVSGIIRHDVPETKYLELGTQKEFDCVGDNQYVQVCTLAYPGPGNDLQCDHFTGQDVDQNGKPEFFIAYHHEPGSRLCLSMIEAEAEHEYVWYTLGGVSGTRLTQGRFPTWTFREGAAGRGFASPTQNGCSKARCAETASVPRPAAGKEQ